MPNIKSTEKIELIKNDLSLNGLKNLLHGVSNLTSLDVSKNDIKCEDCLTNNYSCKCNLVWNRCSMECKIDVLTQKVANPRDFNYQDQQCSYYNEKIMVNRGTCENRNPLKESAYLCMYKTIYCRSKLKQKLKNLVLFCIYPKLYIF